jgi:hypothetical protein
MAFKVIKRRHCSWQDGAICEFVCDAETDVAQLPKCCAGSVALVVSTGNVYVVNANGNWVKFGG